MVRRDAACGRADMKTDFGHVNRRGLWRDLALLDQEGVHARPRVAAAPVQAWIERGQRNLFASRYGDRRAAAARRRATA
jgi:hypothetical protein